MMNSEILRTFVVTMRLFTCLLLFSLLLGSCREQPSAEQFTHEVLNRFTPVKDQGRSQTCWVYAMLAAIETEHIMRGDSVNLSPAYVEKMLERETAAPASRRGMGATLLRLIAKYGIVGYEAMRSTDYPAPRRVFMYGAEYTPLEFAHSVCAPGEYVALTSNGDEPYGQEVVVDLPDNWLHDRFLNVPMDTLLARTERAVRHHHGVCWESKIHAMSIVGIAHDERGRKYFVMKNSWGTDGPYEGLDYLSFDDFREKTLAVEMTKEAYQEITCSVSR